MTATSSTAALFRTPAIADSLRTTENVRDFFREIEFRIDQAEYALEAKKPLNYYELLFGPEWEAVKGLREIEFIAKLAQRYTETSQAIEDYLAVHDVDGIKAEYDHSTSPLETNPAYYVLGANTLAFDVDNAYEVLVHRESREKYDAQLEEVIAFWEAAPEEVRTLPQSHYHLRDDLDLIGVEGKAALKNWGSMTTGSPMISVAAPELITAIGILKEANIRAQFELGELQNCRPVIIPGRDTPVDPKLICDCIAQASREFADGDFNHHFNIPMLQGGAGTSINMTANEIIANRANMILYAVLGMEERYNPADLYNPAVHLIHPNDHVNFPNSTNDVVPTAVNLMTILRNERLVEAFSSVRTHLAALAEQDDFQNTVKQGRTHLQSAVPMTYAQEFKGYVFVLDCAIASIEDANAKLFASTLGANAAGTGINSVEGYNLEAAKQLNRLLADRQVPGFENREVLPVDAQHLTATTWSQFDLLQYHSTVRNALMQVNQVANNIRYYASADCGEVVLSPKQAGSSIMPGKVNPTMAEVLNQAYQVVLGNDITMSEAAASAQLQLQVFGPTTIHAMSNTQEVATKALRLFAGECLDGLTLNADRIRENLGRGPSLATALNPIIGYKAAAAIVEEMRGSKRTIWEVLHDDPFMDDLKAKYEFMPESILKARIALDPDNLLQHTRPHAKSEH